MTRRTAAEWQQWIADFSRGEQTEAWRGIMCFLRWIQIRRRTATRSRISCRPWRETFITAICCDECWAARNRWKRRRRNRSASRGTN